MVTEYIGHLYCTQQISYYKFVHIFVLISSLMYFLSRLLTDNYTSITKKHFLPSKGSSGIDPFSRGLYMTATSGFVKDIPVTVPRSKQVRKIFFFTQTLLNWTECPVHVNSKEMKRGFVRIHANQFVQFLLSVCKDQSDKERWSN